MSRVIKFRGLFPGAYTFKRRIFPGTREWKYGDLIRVEGETRIFDGEHEWVVIPETIGQYIGTAAGREVYEGDLYRDVNGRTNDTPYEIVWVQDSSRYGAKYEGGTFAAAWDIGDAWHDVYVGTIHDHLLTRKPAENG